MYFNVDVEAQFVQGNNEPKGFANTPPTFSIQMKSICLEVFF